MSIESLKTAIVDGDDETAKAATEELVKAGTAPLVVMESAVQPALTEVSDKLVSGEMFIADLILTGEAAKACINLITPLLAKVGGGKYVGKVVLGVVEGDTHDIGKDIVKAMLIGAGFDVVDLETNVFPSRFIEAIKEHNPQIVGASAFTSESAEQIGRLNDALIEAKVRDRIKLMIGGSAVYRDDVPRFGADAFGYDALEAVQLAKRMVRGA